MSHLVVYHQDNLLNPVKLLNRLDDISATLAEVDVALRQVELPEKLREAIPGEALSENLANDIERSCGAGDFSCAELRSYKGSPGYAADDPSQGEQEHYHREPSQLLVLKGGGVLCIHIAESLYVLGCGPGDVIGLPAKVAKWFQPKAGTACTVAHRALTRDGLKACLTGSDIASRVQLPDL